MICNGQTNRNCRSKQCISHPRPKRHSPGNNRNKRPQRHKDQHQVNAMTTPRQKQRRRHIKHKQRNRGNRNHECSEPQHDGPFIPRCSKHRHICAVQLQQRLRNGNRGQRQIHSPVPSPLGRPLFLLCLVIPHSYRTVASYRLSRSNYLLVLHQNNFTGAVGVTRIVFITFSVCGQGWIPVTVSRSSTPLDTTRGSIGVRRKSKKVSVRNLSFRIIARTNRATDRIRTAIEICISLYRMVGETIDLGCPTSSYNSKSDSYRRKCRRRSNCCSRG